MDANMMVAEGFQQRTLRTNNDTNTGY